MKILMIEPIGYGGINIYSLQLCNSLFRSGCAVALATSRLFDSANNKTEYPVYKFLGGCNRKQSRVYRALDYFVSWRELAWILYREKPNLVHIQNAFVPIIDIPVILTLRILGFPVIYTVHDVDRSAMMTRQKWRAFLNCQVDRFLYRIVSRLIVHTTESREELQKNYSIPLDKIHQIRHGNQAYHVEGISIPERSFSRNRLQIPQDAFTVLFFGDRRPSKGLDLLIRAFAEACKTDNDLCLIIAGEQRLLDTTDYQKLSQESGIQPWVRFHDGFVPKEDVPVFFTACDIVALPYRKIYQSGVVHLAFVFNKPVIASRVGGLSEVVEEGKTGFFIDDPEDVRQLAKVLLMAKTNKQLLDSMGAEAKKVEMEVYGWEAIAAETMDMYMSLKKARGTGE